ncbi:hypothetical protein [Lacisediminihabitans sp.]|uniref:hypothetical protein n=1 Tax=Lacisediminihabitans sp. TaxID=2787631 RepID=UPI002F92C6A9
MTTDSTGGHGRRGRTEPIVPADPRNPGDAFLQQEIEQNRRSERWLIPKAILALAVVAALIVLREVFFV